MVKSVKPNLTLVIQLLALMLGAWAIEHPEDFVNLLAGTFTDGNKFSTGNTLPLVGMPWAFNHWSPQTRDDSRFSGSWWFSGGDHTLTWMRCTHQPSPWIGDWGYFLFSPQIGGLDRNPHHFWEPRGATIKPYLFDATVAPHGIRIELAPTMHAAILRVTFPSAHLAEKRICFAQAEWMDQGNSPAPYITARSLQVHHERMIISNFAMHIRAESSSATSIESMGDLMCFRYKDDASVVIVRMATSLISQQQASINLNREIPVSKGFGDIAEEGRTAWHK